MPTDTPRLALTKPAAGDLVSAFPAALGPDLDTLDAEMLRWRGAWSAATAYAANDLVVSVDVVYLATAASTNQAPPNASFWRPFDATAVAATTITAATHTAAAADAGKVVRMTFAGASTLTIPANATTAFAIGTIINAYAAGGTLTLAAAAGVTIRNNAAALAQYGECSLRKDGTDEWVRVG